MTFWMWFSVMEAKKGQCEMSKRKNADFLIPLNSHILNIYSNWCSWNFPG